MSDTANQFEESIERSPYAFQGAPVTSPDPEAKEPAQFSDIAGLLIALITAQVILIAIIYGLCKLLKRHSRKKGKS